MSPRIVICFLGAILVSGVVLVNAQRKLIPVAIDRRPPPASLEEAGNASTVVAVVRLVGRQFQTDFDGRPVTEFYAEVLDVLRKPQDLALGTHINILRDGGMKTVDGIAHIQEEQGFPLWSVGTKVVVFLGWSQRYEAFYPRFGPEYVFEEDSTGKARIPGHLASTSHRGRPFADVVANIRAAVR
jgi:hypothetical protein